MPPRLRAKRFMRPKHPANAEACPPGSRIKLLLVRQVPAQTFDAPGDEAH